MQYSIKTNPYFKNLLNIYITDKIDTKRELGIDCVLHAKTAEVVVYLRYYKPKYCLDIDKFVIDLSAIKKFMFFKTAFKKHTIHDKKIRALLKRLDLIYFQNVGI